MPGQTLSITRRDSSPAHIHVRVNSVRGSVAKALARQTNLMRTNGYKRPIYVSSTLVEVLPGETIQLTSPYGGPLHIYFDANDNDVSFKVENIGRHPFWDDLSDTTAFMAALNNGAYDWAEFITPDFEVHSKNRLMLSTINRPDVGSTDALYNAIVNQFINYSHMLAGFSGEHIPVVPEIVDFADSRDLELKPLDVVKHVNADRTVTTVSTAAAGNPYDTDSGFDPYSGSIHGHELGHGIEFPVRFTGWGVHTQTDLYYQYNIAEQYRLTGDTLYSVIAAAPTTRRPCTTC